MVRQTKDMPDDYKWMPGSSRYVLEDMGELAVRLGSPSRFDRRGEIIWMDDFKSGTAGWWTYGSGTGYEVYVDNQITLQSPFCVVLTAGSDASQYAEIRKFFSAEVVGRAGIEFAVAFDTEFDFLYIELWEGDGNTHVKGKLAIYDTGGVINVYDADDVSHEIGSGFSYGEPTQQYHLIKLVVDFYTGMYVRLVIDQNSYDLSDISLFTEDAADNPSHRVYLYLFGREGENDACRVGHAILTGNEF